MTTSATITGTAALRIYFRRSVVYSLHTRDGRTLSSHNHSHSHGRDATMRRICLYIYRPPTELLRTCLAHNHSPHSRAIYLLPTNNLLRYCTRLHGRRAPMSYYYALRISIYLTYHYSCFLITSSQFEYYKRRKDVNNKNTSNQRLAGANVRSLPPPPPLEVVPRVGEAAPPRGYEA